MWNARLDISCHLIADIRIPHVHNSGRLYKIRRRLQTVAEPPWQEEYNDEAH
jgi:hypothetical protein